MARPRPLEGPHTTAHTAFIFIKGSDSSLFVMGACKQVNKKKEAKNHESGIKFYELRGRERILWQMKDEERNANS